MDSLLDFFSNLILFTAGVAVVLVWLVIFLIIADEIIDLFINYRNNKTAKEVNS